MPTQGRSKRRAASQSTEKPAKRKRVSRACDQCRVAREKCDGVQPTCSTCLGSKRGCTYTANPKKRGIQPGYIRTLELALTWLFQQNPENETLLNEKLAAEGASSFLLSRNSNESNKIHRKWRKGAFYRDVDKLLSGGEPSRLEPSELLSPQSDDEDSGIEEALDLSLIRNGDFEQGLTDEVAPFNPADWQPSIPMTYDVHSSTMVALPLDCWRLFETYFVYTHSWFPICEKHDILKLSYSYPAQGLDVLPDLPDSGSHAETWSILAVASIQETAHGDQNDQPNQPLMTPKQLYDTTRLWIPNETGAFDLGHVKALLNLAIFNIAQSLIEPAWLLVGYASRMLEAINNRTSKLSSRKKNTYFGCFILDSFLALQLGRHSYFQHSELKRLGYIDDDSLEEWQPWIGGHRTSAQQQTRIPVLAISSYNGLFDVVDILTSNRPSDNSVEPAAHSLEKWKTSLPTKLDHLWSGTATTALTPPAVLLQLVYHTSLLSIAPSYSGLCRLLQLFERAREQLGLMSLPPVVIPLLDTIKKHSAELAPNGPVHARIERLQLEIGQSWRVSSPTNGVVPTQSNDHTARLQRRSITVTNVPTPTSLPNPQMAGQITEDGSLQDMSTPHDIFPSGIHTTPDHHHQPLDPFPDLSNPAALPDPRHPDTAGELESFFDDLASLDSTNRLENQPQFMQNLGFAPDANMADLFSEYIPFQQSPTFTVQENPEPLPPFEQYAFYGGS